MLIKQIILLGDLAVWPRLAKNALSQYAYFKAKFGHACCKSDVCDNKLSKNEQFVIIKQYLVMVLRRSCREHDCISSTGRSISLVHIFIIPGPEHGVQNWCPTSVGHVEGEEGGGVPALAAHAPKVFQPGRGKIAGVERVRVWLASFFENKNKLNIGRNSTVGAWILNMFGFWMFGRSSNVEWFGIQMQF